MLEGAELKNRSLEKYTLAVFFNSVSNLGLVVSTLLLLLPVTLVFILQQRLENSTPALTDLTIIPKQIGDYEGVDQPGLGLSSRETLKLDLYLRRIYRSPEHGSLFLYLGFWNKQTGEHQAAKHSPSLCLPANGWVIKSRTKESFFIKNKAEPLYVNRVIAEFKGKEQVFYYWFFSGNREYTDEIKALVYISLERIFHGRSDGGIIEFSLPFAAVTREEGLTQAREKFEAFLKDFYPIYAEAMGIGSTQPRTTP